MLDVTLLHDAVIARFRGVPAQTVLHFKLSQPLHREAELRRIVASRLERLKLEAPSVGMQLTVPRLAPLVTRQLSLSELLTGDTTSGEEDLPLVLAELSADIGDAQVGVLSLVDAHRPEAQSTLGAALARARAHGKRHRKKGRAEPEPRRPSLRCARPSRPFGRACRARPRGFCRTQSSSARSSALAARCVLGHTLYTIERLRFEQRLDAVEWWSRPVARDYLRLWLHSESGGLEALVYVDRHSGRRFLQAVGD